MSVVSVLLLLGLGHIRWTELKKRREKANIPLIELVSVASKDCEKNLLDASMNKSEQKSLEHCCALLDKKRMVANGYQ